MERFDFSSSPELCIQQLHYCPLSLAMFFFSTLSEDGGNCRNKKSTQRDKRVWIFSLRFSIFFGVQKNAHTFSSVRHVIVWQQKQYFRHFHNLLQYLLGIKRHKRVKIYDYGQLQLPLLLLSHDIIYLRINCHFSTI
jgi:hypothetical protein